jgi:hypothetical protein
VDYRMPRAFQVLAFSFLECAKRTVSGSRSCPAYIRERLCRNRREGQRLVVEDRCIGGFLIRVIGKLSHDWSALKPDERKFH